MLSQTIGTELQTIAFVPMADITASGNGTSSPEFLVSCTGYGVKQYRS